MAKKTRFTIYDKMNNDGVFELNPANAIAPDRTESGEPFKTWPVPYPRMLYHPLGEEVVTVAGEIIMTPMGPKQVNQQHSLITKIVRTEAEHKAALDQGWHESPAESRAFAAGKTPDDQIEDVEEQIRALQLKQDAIRARGVKTGAVGSKVA